MELFGLQPRQLLSSTSQPLLPFENRLQRFGFGLDGAEEFRRVCFGRIPRVDLGRDGLLDSLCFDEGRLSLKAAQQGGEKSQPLLLQLLAAASAPPAPSGMPRWKSSRASLPCWTASTFTPSVSRTPTRWP